MKVEFSGGLETLFEGQKSLEISAPENSRIGWLLKELASRVRGDLGLFLQDGAVRPGVLVLINDTDWELYDEMDYVLSNSDVIHFASTLHGG